jgi:membrane-associated phospholipid phosphatase
MEQIIGLDRAIFRIIHTGCSNDFFDSLFPVFRNSITWVPLYLFLLVFVLINYKRNAGWWVLIAVATAVASDFISSDLIKGNIFRLRPCHDPSLANLLVTYCPQSSSFTSSHAMNHFCFATFTYFTLWEVPSVWRRLFFLWAALICFGQVYVGVHYPFDVVAGALLGVLLGYIVAKLFNSHYRLAR